MSAGQVMAILVFGAFLALLLRLFLRTRAEIRDLMASRAPDCDFCDDDECCAQADLPPELDAHAPSPAVERLTVLLAFVAPLAGFVS